MTNVIYYLNIFSLSLFFLCLPYYLYLYHSTGSKLCIRYPQSLSDFADILEAFLLNVGAHALTIELMGKFENFLVTDYQKVINY